MTTTQQTMTEREALEIIAGGYTSRFPGAPDPMTATSPAEFRSSMWTWSQQVARSALSEPAPAPVAWRVWARGRKFTRGLYEKPTQEDFEIWKADGDEVEPLYLAPQS